MTTIPTFPTLKGQSWSVHRTPKWATQSMAYASGRESRAPSYQFPIWEFELTFDGLDSGSKFAGLGAASLQTIMGFFLSAQGQAGNFLFVDPDDSYIAGQALGTGDGAATTFTIVRTLGGFVEPVGAIVSVGNVYLNGVYQPTGWTATSGKPCTLTFATAPGSGVAVTIDFTFAFICRFSDDVQDFEEFASMLWNFKTCKFESTRQLMGFGDYPPPITVPIGPPPPPTYTASAVHFAGSIQSQGPTYIEIPSLACTDDGTISFSFWSKGLSDGANGNCTLFVVDPHGRYITYLATNPNTGAQADYLIVYLGQYIMGPLNWQSFYPTTDGNWHHYLGSYYANEPAGLKIGALYIDDVLISPSVPSDIDANIVMAMNGLSFYFGDDLFNDGPTVDLADVWIAPGVNLLASGPSPSIPSANRRIFTTSINQPIDPTTFPPAAILWTGDASTFATNLGTGGAGTVTGTITNATTHP